MSAAENIEIVRQAMNAYYQEGAKGYARFLADDAVNYVPGKKKPLTSRKAIQEDNEQFESMFSKLGYENVSFFGSGEKVCAQGVVTGTLNGSSKQIRVPVCMVATIQDGKLVQIHEYFDRQEFADQMTDM